MILFSVSVYGGLDGQRVQLPIALFSDYKEISSLHREGKIWMIESVLMHLHVNL